MSFVRPYEGVKVVDLSQGVAGPYCGMLLAQQGADVVKIEPKEGDWSRVLGRQYGDHTAFSIPANMGKRGMVVDLKSEDSREILERLVRDADVFIEGFRPGVIKRLGWDYERVKELKPDIIYVSVSGFGQTGPMAELPAMDPLLQAFTGFMSENKGPDGIPHRTPTIIFDMATSLYGMQAVGAALYAKRDHGRGRKIELSLMEVAANLQTIRLLDGYREGPFKIAAAPSGTFETSDGFIQTVVVKNHEFQKLCKALDKPDWADDPRFANNAGRLEHSDYLMGEARAAFKRETTATWRKRLSAEGVQNEAIQSYREFATHPQVEAVGLISWLVQAGDGGQWPVPNLPGGVPYEQGAPHAISPTIGQHTDAVMGELGFSETQIAEMKKAGVIS